MELGFNLFLSFKANMCFLTLWFLYARDFIPFHSSLCTTNGVLYTSVKKNQNIIDIHFFKPLPQIIIFFPLSFLLLQHPVSSYQFVLS